MSDGAAPEPMAGGGSTPPPPLSLYVHLPWCLAKCPYCDFNSHAKPAELDDLGYVDALIDELEQSLPWIWGRSIISIFIGGGTPSLFSAAAIDRLLAGCRARLRLVGDCEVTLEANPGTFERARFADFRAAGINRLSLGVQSFDDRLLGAIGRVHDGAQAAGAAQAAAQLFERFNLDLMYALPGQTVDQLATDLRRALDFSPPHLSIYHLTIEPNTLFARQPPRLPDDDTASTMLDEVVTMLGEAGLARYEVSAFARADARCRHNMNYWQFGDYLGLGAGAHSKLTIAGVIERIARVRHPQTWLDAVRRGESVASRQRVAPDDLPFEFMLNALRLVDGVPSEWFEARTGASLASIAAPIEQAVRRGLLRDDPLRLAPTPFGLDFLNDLQQLFLPRLAARTTIPIRRTETG